MRGISDYLPEVPAYSAVPVKDVATGDDSGCVEDVVSAVFVAKGVDDVVEDGAVGAVAVEDEGFRARATRGSIHDLKRGALFGSSREPTSCCSVPPVIGLNVRRGRWAG